MTQTIIGIILLGLPFLLATLFKDKKRGFVYLIFGVILFHTALAFFTQLFGVFYYSVILWAIIPADVITLGVLWKYRNKISFKIYKIDWVVILVIIIAFLSLYQVHYNYTGKINLATDTTVSYHEVKNMEYAYPYFSDEWYAVSLIKHSVNSHSLPLWNDLSNSFFLNLEMFFHSFTAEIMLILSLNPLTQYVLLSIFFNVLIIILAYVFLRISKVSKLSSAIASLSILYMTCGANLPGIWNLIPVHLGIIFCLIGFCFMAMDNFWLALAASLPVIFFYGPLFIFYGLALAVFLAIKFKESIKNHINAIIFSIITILLATPVICIILMISPLFGTVNYIFSRVFYISLYGPNIATINFYNIIPVWAILLAILGLPLIFKNKKWLFSVLALGIIYWIFYSFTITRFVIEYERVVFFISIIIAIISGFGLQWLEARVRFLKYAWIGALLLFLILVPFYTQREGWSKITLANIYNGVRSYPKAPANNYLTEGDLKIFSGITNKRFLSLPWKGTVIGVATDNYPLVGKEGIISPGSRSDLLRFGSLDCNGKKNMAKSYKIDYIYMYNFDCPGFKKTSRSQEGLILYKVD